jgi:hypothetical protein
MASRPHPLLSPNPSVVAATFTPHRPGTSSDRNLAAWRVVRWKERHMQTPATLDSAVIAAPSSAATVRQSQRDAEERLASIGRCADLGESVHPSALPAVRRVQDKNSRWRLRGIPTWVGYAGRLITFNLTVVSIHLAVLRWILLPIGG